MSVLNCSDESTIKGRHAVLSRYSKLYGAPTEGSQYFSNRTSRETSQGAILMVYPSKSLIEFHHRFCPDIPIDSPIVVYALLEKLAEKYILWRRKNGKKSM